jgi:hypothetical protein
MDVKTAPAHVDPARTQGAIISIAPIVLIYQGTTNARED